ncbi:hypothetical protein ACSBLW_12290 [Thioclava sp. FR2]|uniref:hypothetical protein n=1 Tax=Thioclava sp. FR2 TaxID=3445780 RepID=UPI003EBFA259
MSLDVILNQLKSTLRRAKGVEALAFWAGNGEWTDALGETLENEEIVFYAEGLLMEGTRLAWQLIAEDGAPDHLRLYFWQESRPEFPPAPEGQTVLETVEAPAP